MNYKIVRFLAGCIVHLLFRIEIVNRGRVPATGGAIISSNHINLFDPVLIALAVDRPIRFMAKEEIFSWPIVGYLARLAGAIPVKRGSADIKVIKLSLSILQGGEIMGIFPEGTRSKTAEMGPLLNGVTMLAEKCDVPIIPAAILGEYRLGRTIKVVIGEPIAVSALTPEPYSRTKATASLMDKIRALRESLR